MSSTPAIKVLIVSTSDAWRRSICALLSSQRQFELLSAARGGLTAYQAAYAERPQLILIDDSLPQEEVLALVSAVNAMDETVTCIVLAPTTHHARAAQATGAEAIVVRSGTSWQLETAVAAARQRIVVLG